MKRKIQILSTLLLILFAFSCKKDTVEEDPSVAPPAVENKAFDYTKVVSPEARNTITAIDTSSFTFTFKAESDLGKELKIGDVIVDSISDKAPNGYLRKVTGVSKSKGEIVVETEQAKLTDALESGDIHFHSGQVKLSQLAKIELADGVIFNNNKNPDFSVFELDYDKTFQNENGSVNIHGHSELSMDLFFDYAWGWQWTPPAIVTGMFESGVELNQASSISIDCEAGAGLNERYNIATFTFTPWTFMVGIVPVVLTPRVQLFLEVDGSIGAMLYTSASESFTGKLGVEYSQSDGWNTIEESNFQHDFVAPLLNHSSEISADVGPEVALLLYGIMGPYVDVTGFGEIDANFYQESNTWDLGFFVGARGRVGLKIDVLGFTENVNFPYELFKDTLMYLSHEPFGNGIYINYPIDGNSYPIGENINFTATYSGQCPDVVTFTIDGEEVYYDSQEPFEFSWETGNMTEGSHTVGVKGTINGVEETTDDASINFYTVYWSSLDLSIYGLSETSTCTDIVFQDDMEGWMTISNSGNGQIYKTNDGGTSWEEQSNTLFPMQEMEILGTDEAIYLTNSKKVKYSQDGGQTLETLEYSDIPGVWQYTFQWKDVFDITTSVVNDEIVAVGKDTGIPDYFHIYRAAIDGHSPTGDYTLPVPNYYGEAPKIAIHQNRGLVYGVVDENNTNAAFYLISSDGGVNWEFMQFSQINNNNTNLNAACFINEDKGWIVGSEGGSAIVMLTTDGCLSWEKVTIDEAASFGSVAFVDSQNGYATVKDNSTQYTGRLYKTQDGGHTWSVVSPVNSSSPMNKVYFLGNNMGFVIGNGSNIYRYHL
jgi:photosystem II stability/assembly factor-like uncharacterized protein